MGPNRSGVPAPVIPGKQGRRPVGSGHVDATLAARARPTSASRDQLLPLLPALAPLLPGGGLQRGGVVVVDATSGDAGTGGGTSLAFALLAAASAASWCAAVGTADLGILALAGMGVDLDHLVLVPRPGPLWAQVTATLLDGTDAVLVRPPGPVRPGMARRLAARARERRAVLVVLARPGGWPEGADVRLTVQAGAWQGVGTGHGHLQGRRVAVQATGRRGATRPVGVGLWLPTPTGQVGADGSAQGIRSNKEVEGERGAAARRVVPGHP